jgi:hypothetical protein
VPFSASAAVRNFLFYGLDKKHYFIMIISTFKNLVICFCLVFLPCLPKLLAFSPLSWFFMYLDLFLMIAGADDLFFCKNRPFCERRLLLWLLRKIFWFVPFVNCGKYFYHFNVQLNWFLLSAQSQVSPTQTPSSSCLFICEINPFKVHQGFTGNCFHTIHVHYSLLWYNTYRLSFFTHAHLFLLFNKLFTNPH